jgi:predicted Zn-dependent peptidase
VSRDEICGYYGAHYVPEKMTVVAAGNFDEKKINKLIGETFGKFEKKAPPAEPAIFEEAHKGEDLTKYGKVEVGYMISGFLGPDIGSDEIFAAEIAANILGGGKSSRLYRVIKEQKHLVYSINASYTPIKGTGTLNIVSVFDPANAYAIKTQITEQLAKIVSEGITEEELARAKLSIKTSWSFAFEQPFDIAHVYGYWNIMGRPGVADLYMQKIDAVTTEDVRYFFAAHCPADAMTHAVMLPHAPVHEGGKAK